MIEKIIIVYMIIINALAILLYGIDKAKAIFGKWRISELMLILVAIIGGAFGAFLGMRIWHHKTKKLKFQVIIPLSVMIWSGILLKVFGIL